MKKIMKNIIAICLLLACSVMLFTGCGGGGATSPESSPDKDYDNIEPAPTPTNKWKVYAVSRTDYICIMDLKQNETSYEIVLNSYNHRSTFMWNSNDGNTVYATLRFVDGNPKGLPTSGTIYNYKNTQSSYIVYNNKTYSFDGYL